VGNREFELRGIGFFGLPPLIFGRGADGLEGLDVERRIGWWRNGEEAFPEIVQSEEELDFLGAQDFVHDLHGGLALGAEQRILAPDAEDEITPEGAQFALGIRREDGDCGREGLIWGCGVGFGMGTLAGDRDWVAPLFEAAGFVGVEAVVADGVVVAVGDVLDGGGEEVGGGEDFKIALGFPVVPGTVDDGGGFFFPGDFLQGEGGAQEILGELAAAIDVVGSDGFFTGVEVEAAVFPVEEITGFLFGEELVGDKGLDEAVAEEFGEGVEGLCGCGGKEMEAAGLIEESAGGEDVKVRVEHEVVAEGLDAGDGGEFAFGQVELEAHPVAQGLGGGAEEVVEEVAALAEDAAEHAGNGEDELAVGDGLAEGFGDPAGGAADAALMAGGAEVSALAGEGEEALVSALGVRALEAGESSGEVAALEEVFDSFDGEGAERAVDLAVFGFVIGEEIVPRMVDNLPEG